MFNSAWYINLTKPAFSPPNWLFAPVWTVLYLFMFASLAFYIYSDEDNKKWGYVFFVIQIILNILWSPVFFGLKNIFLALMILLSLDVFVFLTMAKFYQASKIACFVLIPYFIWILFATYLNIGYLVLN